MNNLYIFWSDIHATNIPVIDEQHRSLVGIINTLYFFMREQMAPEITMPVVFMLDKYAQIHFQTEEYILELTEYPNIKEHKKLHEDYSARIRTLSSKSKQTLEPDELLAFLKDWWIRHINRDDRGYSSYVLQDLRKKGKLRDI